MISSEKIKAVKESIPIVALIGSFIPLKRTGRIYVGRCPFHDDHNPSFIVYPKTDSFHCFGCGAGKRSNGISGDAIGFVMGYQKINFHEAVKYLQNFSPSIAIDDYKREYKEVKKRVITPNTLMIYKHAMEYYHSLIFENQIIYRYLTSKYSVELIKHFKLGIAPGYQHLYSHLLNQDFTTEEILNSGICRMKNKIYDYFWGNVIIYPHFIDNEIIGFTIKDPDEKRDLRWKLGFNDHFYNQNILKKHKSIIIVEGENDLFKHYTLKRKNVVALCGTFFGESHKDILLKYGVKEVLLDLDPDEAGKKATLRIKKILRDPYFPERKENYDN